MSTATTTWFSLSSLFSSRPAGALVWIDPHGRLREQWQPHLETLRSWRCSPDELTDDDIEAPSQEIIELALELAQSMIQESLPSPTCVVPTVDGGIAFERRSGDWLERVEIETGGHVEIMQFFDSRIVDRSLVNLGAPVS